ncbi:uncharacterized protein CMU_006140 [Cryptosporidium muris RN66]|uniref:Uncharacterized protein n=1 Tax=Cryptosporidium muris (strain RN66) TaxID=441375 RepID=B6AHJ6_CRYMR|nr:uncharacterized protein CMU_006140 [Cryptosporidium muris RN66]EEA07691.1 hypothetical protein, conserved [Cryptosporidium muris RN66]|eukprot:XP_002142040.1 hypothetical protein [Cryptosporidium muris RN66]
MSGYSGVSYVISEGQKTLLSQASPVELATITTSLRYKGYHNASWSLYKCQSDYYYWYNYYTTQVEQFEKLEHSISIKICNIMSDKRLRLDNAAQIVLKNYTDEQIVLGYTIPSIIPSSEHLLFKEYVRYLSTKRYLVEMKKKVWESFRNVEIKKKVIEAWEYDYNEALKEKNNIEYFNNVVNYKIENRENELFGNMQKIRIQELRIKKEQVVLNITGENKAEGSDIEEQVKVDNQRSISSTNNDRTCCDLFGGKRRVTLYRSKSSSPPKAQFKENKELRELPPKPNSPPIPSIDLGTKKVTTKNKDANYPSITTIGMKATSRLSDPVIPNKTKLGEQFIGH